MNKVVAIIFGVFLSANFALAQQKNDGIEYSGFFDTYYYRGPVNYYIGGGLTTLRGDIPKIGDNFSYYGTIGASYQVWPRTYFGADLSYFSLTGSSDKNFKYEYENTGVGLDLYGRFLLIDRTVTRHGQLRDKPYRIRPYISSGITMFSSLSSSSSISPNIKTVTTTVDSSGNVITVTTTNSNDIANTKVAKSAFLIPVGLGFQIFVSHRVSVMPEVVYRFALSDNLDGIKLMSDKSGMDGLLTAGIKLQITPGAARMHKKKKTLSPPEQYNGPKGTDYPRKREEAKPKNYGQPLPGEEEQLPQEGGENQDGTQPEGTEQQQEQPQDGTQQNEQQNNDAGW